METISIIVPIYNAELFLEKSIQTLLDQTLKKIEIILVNDGSTDNSLNICYKLQSKDNRIKVFSKENQGVSSARNFGIKKSTGKYIGFFDADDFVMPDMFEILLDNLLSTNSDMACVKYVITKENKLKYFHDKHNVVVFNNEDALKSLLTYKSIYNEVVVKLFKKEIITSYNLEFPLEYTIAEDRYFVFNYLLYCKNICYNSIRKYNYVYRNTSAMHSQYSLKNISSFYVSEDILKIVNEKKPFLSEYAEMGYYIAKINNLKLMIKEKKIDKTIQPFYFKVLADLNEHDYNKYNFWKYLSTKKKIEYFFMKHFYGLFCIIIKIFNIKKGNE